MKKLTLPALLLALALLCSAAALAATPPTLAPTSVERTTIDGTAYIVKTYEAPPDTDPADLPGPAFLEDGWLFAHETTAAREQFADVTKPVTETVTAESESRDLADVLKKFPSTLPYDRDGFTGALVLDAGSIATEAAGYTTKTNTVSTTKTFPGLMYADPTALPQTAVKDGVTLPLLDVNWAVTGTSLAGDSLVPTEYMATATYGKKVSWQVATGYVSAAVYRGEVSKREVTGVVYTLTYKGDFLPAPEPEPIPEPLAAEPFPWEALLAGLAVILLVGGGGFAALFLHARRGVRVYNRVEDDYVCIGRQRIDLRRPGIDLNAFGDVIQSRFFAFALDKRTTRKLFGRNISVTLGDVTVRHMVRDMTGPYRFNLEIGGDLDA